MYKIIPMKAGEGKEKAASRCKDLMPLVIDESRRRYSAMKNARRMLAGFYILISVFSFFSLSGCEGGYYRGGNRGYSGGDIRGDRHYYRDGRWYRRGPSGVDIVVSALVIGAFIESLPPRHTTVVVENTQYYHDDNYYYRHRSEGGYVVVQAPVKVKPQSQRNNDERQERGSNSRNEKNQGEKH